MTDWKVGDRAGGAWLGGSCGVCSYRASGREKLCERAEFTGWGRDGGYATRASLRADFAFRLPDGFDDVSAAPLWWERSICSVANFTCDDAREFLELALEIPLRTAAAVYPLVEANRALSDLAMGMFAGRRC